MEQIDSKGCVLVHMISDTLASSFCHCKACPEQSERTRQSNLVAGTPGQIWREGERGFLLRLPRLQLAMTVGGARNDVWEGLPRAKPKMDTAKTKPLVGLYSPAGVV